MVATVLLLATLIASLIAQDRGAYGDVCNMPLDEGSSCGSSKKKEAWYYRPEKDDCNYFIFLGCGGNKNRFTSLSDCEKTCKRNPPCHIFYCPDSCQSTTDKNNCIKCVCTKGTRRRICSEPLERGNGRALMSRWGWDTKTKSCKDFDYGGLPGNDNNFSSRKECEEFCSGIY